MIPYDACVFCELLGRAIGFQVIEDMRAAGCGDPEHYDVDIERRRESALLTSIVKHLVQTAGSSDRKEGEA